MDSIFSLITFLINLSLAGGAIILTIKVLKFRKKSDYKNEIDNLQAKISLMRISLKSKVKKKSFTFRSQFPKALNSRDVYDTALNALIENPLETGNDLQNYFDLSRQINTYISFQVPGYAPSEDFMSNDFRNEIEIIRLIKDISSLSARLNKKIDAYNNSKPTVKLPAVDNLIFTAMMEVNRIFSTHHNPTEEMIAPSGTKKPAA